MVFLTPNASGERELLKTFVLQQLAQVRSTAHGLTDEQLHATPSASALSVGALVLHCGQVAVGWSTMAADAPGEARMPDELGSQLQLDQAVADTRTVAETLDYFDRCVDYTGRTIDRIDDLGAPIPVPDAPWYPPELTSWEARWALAHMIAEIARHAGHADIIRETIDGKGSFELNARADGDLADDDEFQPYG